MNNFLITFLSGFTAAFLINFLTGMNGQPKNMLEGNGVSLSIIAVALSYFGTDITRGFAILHACILAVTHIIHHMKPNNAITHFIADIMYYGSYISLFIVMQNLGSIAFKGIFG